jgi:cubilin
MVYGGSLTGPTGQIASPLYPAEYPNSLDITWTIFVSGDARVRIVFTAFDVESGFGDECLFDAVNIYDGADSLGPLLLSACGQIVPDSVETTGAAATVTFTTDSSVTNPGWLLQWQEVTGPPPSPPPQACGGVLSAGDVPQNFSSPGFPNGYAPSQDCRWLIEADPGRTVMLTFTYLDLEDHPLCSYDYIQLFDGPTDALDTSLVKYCSRQVPSPPPVYSTSNTMYAVFSSDASINGTGFQATYQSHCGGTRFSQFGIITSPSYPSNYPNNQDCTWVVQAATGSTIRVTFDAGFSVLPAGTCSDVVEVYNGGDETSPLLGSYCGTTVPPQTETSGNLLRVRFRTDGSVTSSGFSLNYHALQQGCGGTVDLTDASPSYQITSPNYPNEYPVNVECIWIVTAPLEKPSPWTLMTTFSLRNMRGTRF